MEIQWTREELSIILTALDKVPVQGAQSMQTVLGLMGKVQGALKSMSAPVIDAAVEKAEKAEKKLKDK